MARNYKWQPHEGGRHAIPQELAVNDVGRTLCGIVVTAGSDSWSDETRYWPTCDECDQAWREHEGILPWPRKGSQVSYQKAHTSDTSTAVSVAELLSPRR